VDISNRYVLTCGMNRRLHSADHNEARSMYHTSTSTGTLCSHLYKFHLDEWVEECDLLGGDGLLKMSEKSSLRSEKESMGEGGWLDEWLGTEDGDSEWWEVARLRTLCWLVPAPARVSAASG
jgi:hypothetical protein